MGPLVVIGIMALVARAFAATESSAGGGTPDNDAPPGENPTGGTAGDPFVTFAGQANQTLRDLVESVAVVQDVNNSGWNTGGNVSLVESARVAASGAVENLSNIATEAAISGRINVEKYIVPITNADVVLVAMSEGVERAGQLQDAVESTVQQGGAAVYATLTGSV